MKNKIRIFKSGANRDTDLGKLDFYGARHPLVEHSFAEYMYGKRKLADGSFRDDDNWWNGWDKKISLKSLVRHTEDLQAIHAGYFVYKIIGKDGEKTVISKKEIKGQKAVTEEEACNAIRFNAGSYLLEVLK